MANDDDSVNKHNIEEEGYQRAHKKKPLWKKLTGRA